MTTTADRIISEIAAMMASTDGPYADGPYILEHIICRDENHIREAIDTSDEITFADGSGLRVVYGWDAHQHAECGHGETARWVTMTPEQVDARNANHDNRNV